MLGYDIEEVNRALVEAAGRPRTVLDVGCGTGINGAQLRSRGAHVTGIETNAAAATLARSRLDQVLELDITRDEDLDALGDRKFDLILFGDVLEHLVAPLDALRRFVDRLEDGGHVIVSLPNIAAWPIRLKLLRGDFSYESSGILDRTHLRFFTRETATKLVQDAGLEVMRVEQNPMLVRAARDLIKPLIGSPTQASTGPVSLESLPSYRAYQKSYGPSRERSPTSLRERSHFSMWWSRGSHRHAADSR
ncbi:MAG: class I SAM-dependent methyltransferase [Polyangiaceae bacterium]